MLVPLLALAPMAYRIVDLGVPPGAELVYAHAINGRGEVLVSTPSRKTGRKDAQGEEIWASGHAFLWRAGRFLDLGEPRPSQFLDPPVTIPTGLNDESVVVGGQGTGQAVFMSGLSDVNPFIWRGKRLEDLGTGWSSFPRAINDLGDIVGDGNHRGWARLNGRIMPIGTLSHVPARNFSGAIGINGHRLILGNSTYGGTPGKIDYDLPSRPFTIDGTRRPLRMVPVPLPTGYRQARGLALNDAGTILAVASDTKVGSVDAPYLVERGLVIRLLMPQGLDFVESAHLNGRGDVAATIGTYGSADRSRPTLWLGGRLAPVPTFSGWSLQHFAGIDDQGEICGTGLHDGKSRAFVLVPFRGFGGRR